MSAKSLAFILATTFIAFSLPAMAESKTKPAADTQSSDAQQLENLVLTRVDAGQVTVGFEYIGGACEEVEPAELGEVVEGTLSVTFPTISTAEMCTMQAVQIEVEETIAVDESVSSIDVILTAPDGTVIGTGSADIGQD